MDAPNESTFEAMGLKCIMVGFWSFCWIVNLWICFCFVALGQKIICLKCSTLQKTLTGFQGSVFNQISTKIRFHFTFVIKFVCKRILSMIGGWDKILCASNKNTILGRFCFLWCENLLRTPFFSYSLFGVEVLIENYARMYDWPATLAS